MTETKINLNLEKLVREEILNSINLLAKNNTKECLWKYLKGFINFNKSNYPKISIESPLDLIKQKLYKVKNWE